METPQMKEEKTIFIRCSEETNDLLETIRKADMPVKSRNSEIIYLIHKEAKELGITAQPIKEVIVGYDANGSPTTEDATVGIKNEEVKSGLGALAETKRQGTLD